MAVCLSKRMLISNIKQTTNTFQLRHTSQLWYFHFIRWHTRNLCAWNIFIKKPRTKFQINVLCTLYFWIWVNFSLWISVSFFLSYWSTRFRRDYFYYLCHSCRWHLSTAVNLSTADRSKLSLYVYQHSCFLNILSTSDILSSNISNIRLAHENCIPIFDLLSNKRDRKRTYNTTLRRVQMLAYTLHRRS
jgi:hypothetical protein